MKTMENIKNNVNVMVNDTKKKIYDNRGKIIAASMSVACVAIRVASVKEAREAAVSAFAMGVSTGFTYKGVYDGMHGLGMNKFEGDDSIMAECYEAGYKSDGAADALRNGDPLNDEELAATILDAMERVNDKIKEKEA